MTNLTLSIDAVKAKLESQEDKLGTHAHDYIESGKKYTDMDENAKSDLFDESVAEFHKSVELVHKKFKLLERKVKDME